jgi:hypothetical protein
MTQNIILKKKKRFKPFLTRYFSKSKVRGGQCQDYSNF